jgi:hypothetical protein
MKTTSGRRHSSSGIHTGRQQHAARLKASDAAVPGRPNADVANIDAGQQAEERELYGMGLREAVARSTLADANELRDWRTGADIAAVLVRRARKLYASDDIGLDLADTVYSAVVRDVDSTSAQIKGPVLTGANSLKLG